MSQPAPGGFVGTITSKSTFGESVLALTIILVVLLIFFTAESIYTGAKTLSTRFEHLMDYTASSEDRALVVHQDAAKYPDAKTILLSQNEPTGTEFAYSFFLYVNPSTFDSGADVLYHVWHKGYGCVWPLMGPGVFIKGSTNAMRIVMNTYENPYTFVDIQNIPIKKWFHVVLNCRNHGLEVHINGNLSNKIRFDKTQPYLNYQDLIIFSNANFILNSQTPALHGNTLQVSGVFSGFMSELIYTRYALSFTEIQSLLHAGPSKKVKKDDMQLPPYMADTWWTTAYSS